MSRVQFSEERKAALMPVQSTFGVAVDGCLMTGDGTQCQNVKGLGVQWIRCHRDSWMIIDMFPRLVYRQNVVASSYVVKTPANCFAIGM